MTEPGNLEEIKGRGSEPSSPVPATFFKSSSPRKSPLSRSRSLSPRKRTANQPLHIRMNLTETQMDKITDAFSQKVNGSHARRDKAAVTAPPDASSSRQRAPGLRNTDHELSSVVSPTFSELMPRHQDESIVERRQKASLPPLDVTNTPKGSSWPKRAQLEMVDPQVSPLSFVGRNESKSKNRPVSSAYSMETKETNQLKQPRPLNLRHSRLSPQKTNPDDTLNDIYNNWASIYGSGITPDTSPSRHSDFQHPRRSKSTVEGLRHQSRRIEAPPVPNLPAEARGPPRAGTDSPLFSPLALYFRGKDFPSVKMGEKVLIGDNGWLERTGHQTEPDKKTPQKKQGLLDSIKKIAKDMTDLHHPSRLFGEHTKAPPSTHVAISLDAREQSLLYCELEYHLTSALNDYISCELDKGRLVPDSFKKIADGWYNKGRPRVVGFRFDLETQVDLVTLHVNDFTFYGRRQCNPVEITSLLQTMKVNARAMSVRTFCQPDSVIAKQLVDTKSLFDMIGVTKGAHMALGEIVEFFKTIVEREQDHGKQRQDDTAHVSRVSHGASNHQDTFH